jgi:hypothetical protein
MRGPRMKLPSYQFFAQMGAAFAVVASLALVAYELKLNREVAMAQIYQERTAILSDHIRGTMGIEAFQQALTSRKLKQPVSETEQRLLDDDQHVLLLFFDNTHYQYTLGLIPDEEWAVVLDALKAEARYLVDEGHLLNHWNETKFGFRASFADIITAEIKDYTAKSKASASQN